MTRHGVLSSPLQLLRQWLGDANGHSMSVHGQWGLDPFAVDSRMCLEKKPDRQAGPGFSMVQGRLHAVSDGINPPRRHGTTA